MLGNGADLVDLVHVCSGSTVAKFTGATLHNRLSKLPAYAAGDYETAMRRAFLATDEDLRASESFDLILSDHGRAPGA